LVIASTNPGKAEELRELLADLPFHVHDSDIIRELGAPVEDGRTFEANARKKAIHYSRRLDSLVIADDSGLEIDALDGEPGLRSARVGGPTATDADRVRLILRKMSDVVWDRRTARFSCSIAIARHGEVLACFSGRVKGRIAFEPDGSAGFGYDPIFYYPPMDMTFAAMTPAEKNHVSHRGQALARAVGWLGDYARKAAESEGTSE